MARTTFTVTTLNGTIAKRTSDSRTYTHAVVTDTRALTWCGSLALAQKQLLTYQNSNQRYGSSYPYAIAEASIK